MILLVGTAGNSHGYLVKCLFLSGFHLWCWESRRKFSDGQFSGLFARVPAGPDILPVLLLLSQLSLLFKFFPERFYGIFLWTSARKAKKSCKLGVLHDLGTFI
jgi:nicotinamide riboside transporter PnuC